jgi:hypothetical protein
MRSDLRTAANEMEIYFTEHGDYPPLSQTARNVTIGDDTFTASPDVTLFAYLPGDPGVNSGTYCLEATSPKGSSDWYYDSDAGGLLKKGSACS